MHIADKAIILAAGLGTRIYPITAKTPKPLIKVNGRRIIEVIIDGLMQNGIVEIYIVTGHLKEQYEHLIQRYRQCQITLLESPYYQIYNNISSLYVAREHLENCIIIEGDILPYNTDILNPRFDSSGYCSVWTDETKEWLQTVDDEGLVLSCSRTGGNKGWRLYGISFWNSQDGKKLKRHLEDAFISKGETDLYWDDIPLFHYADEYQLKIKKINQRDIVEIDNLEELCEIDHSYRKIDTEGCYEQEE